MSGRNLLSFLKLLLHTGILVSLLLQILRQFLLQLLFNFLLALVALLLDFIPTVRVCVRELILLQFIADILWILLLVILRLLAMRFLILILMEFLLILVTIILRLLMMVVLIVLKTVLLNFRSGVKVCVRGPPYTTAPPCNAWGNAPVDDS